LYLRQHFNTLSAFKSPTMVLPKKGVRKTVKSTHRGIQYSSDDIMCGHKVPNRCQLSNLKNTSLEANGLPHICKPGGQSPWLIHDLVRSNRCQTSCHLYCPLTKMVFNANTPFIGCAHSWTQAAKLKSWRTKFKSWRARVTNRYGCATSSARTWQAIVAAIT